MADDEERKRREEIRRIRQLHRLRESTTHDGEAEAAREAMVRKLKRHKITWPQVWEDDDDG